MHALKAEARRWPTPIVLNPGEMEAEDQGFKVLLSHTYLVQSKAGLLETWQVRASTYPVPPGPEASEL